MRNSEKLLSDIFMQCNFRSEIGRKGADQNGAKTRPRPRLGLRFLEITGQDVDDPFYNRFIVDDAFERWNALMPHRWQHSVRLMDAVLWVIFVYLFIQKALKTTLIKVSKKLLLPSTFTRLNVDQRLRGNSGASKNVRLEINEKNASVE